MAEAVEKEQLKAQQYFVRNSDESFFQLPIKYTTREKPSTGTTSMQRPPGVNLEKSEVLAKVIINKKPEIDSFISFTNPFDETPILLYVRQSQTKADYYTNQEDKEKLIETQKNSVYVDRIYKGDNDAYFQATKDKLPIHKAEMKIIEDQILLELNL